VTEVFVSVGSLRVDLGQQFFCPIDLFNLAIAWSESHLLVSQLSQDRIQIIGVHLEVPSSAQPAA
jgi:hypothetical protein